MTKKFLIQLLFVCALLIFPLRPVAAQDPTPTATLAPTEGPPASDRPVVMIDSYALSTTPARGEDFSMSILFLNSGRRPSYNLFIEFVSGDLIPRGNGGMQTIYQLIMGEKKGLSQGFTVNVDLWDARLATVVINLEYSDDLGNSYADSFAIAIDLKVPTYAAVLPTPTPTPISQPQLVIDSFDSDVEILQPGTAFELSMLITNLGNSGAHSAAMVLGGGSVEVNPEGTPQPGISGGGGEFTIFAPLESSNVKFVGDIGPGETISVSQKIIVNVSTAPGAYSLIYSFIYTTESGERIEDNQVITLLIYRMPMLEVGFYQDPGQLLAFQPNNLPLQVMNLGKQGVVLGNMTVSCEKASLENNTALVGPIEAGFYFTLDSMIIPNEPGPLDLKVSINYTDDFNQPRVYETVLTLDVMEGEPFPGGEGLPQGDGMDMPINGELPSDGNFGGEETFWQKIIRFFRGLLGLDSSVQNNLPQSGPYEEMPPDEMIQPVVVP